MGKNIKAILCLTVTACLMLVSGCGRGRQNRSYTAEFYSVFDTMSTITVYTDSEEEFQTIADKIENELTKYHQLYDIYHTYDGIANIKDINDQAGIRPVEVSQDIIDLLKFGQEMYEKTDGMVNIAFGSVLKIWHDYREAGQNNPEEAQLPPMDALEEAYAHTDIDQMIIDEEASTVYLADADMSLDVGAIAKGYATEKVADMLEGQGISHVLLDIGGNIRAIGDKPDGTLWRLGLQNPDLDSDENYVHIIELESTSLVTSGDYQRYYTVNGKRYHHIIDPQTLMPSDRFTDVSVIYEVSGISDAMSTALFNMDIEEGKALAESVGAEVLWIFQDGSETMTDGFADYISE